MANDVEYVTAYLPVSEGALDDAGRMTGMIAAALRGELPRSEPKPPPPTPDSHTALLEATDGPLRAVVELHEPVWEGYRGWECRGCDAEGYEWEPPYWPCSTVELIAERLGVWLGGSDAARWTPDESEG